MATNVTSHSMMPQLAASSGGTSKMWLSVAMVANCDPPPTPGSWTSDPTMLEAIRQENLRSAGSPAWACAVGVRDFLVGHRDHRPHQHRNADQAAVSDFLLVDGVQATAKFADSHGDAVTQVGCEVRKAPFDPAGECLAFAVHGKRAHGEADHDHESKRPHFLKTLPEYSQSLRARSQQKAASTNRKVKPPTSKMRSTAQTASWEEKGKFSGFAMR